MTTDTSGTSDDPQAGWTDAQKHRGYITLHEQNVARLMKDPEFAQAYTHFMAEIDPHAVVVERPTRRLAKA